MVRKSNPPDEKILWQIYENLIRAEERLKSLTELNKTEHEDIRQNIEKFCQKQEEMDKRLQDLERKGFALTWIWKLIILTFGAIPTLITILNIIGIL